MDHIPVLVMKDLLEMGPFAKTLKSAYLTRTDVILMRNARIPLGHIPVLAMKDLREMDPFAKILMSACWKHTDAILAQRATIRLDHIPVHVIKDLLAMGPFAKTLKSAYLTRTDVILMRNARIPLGHIPVLVTKDLREMDPFAKILMSACWKHTDAILAQRATIRLDHIPVHVIKDLLAMGPFAKTLKSAYLTRTDVILMRNARIPLGHIPVLVTKDLREMDPFAKILMSACWKHTDAILAQRATIRLDHIPVHVIKDLLAMGPFAKTLKSAYLTRTDVILMRNARIPLGHIPVLVTKDLREMDPFAKVDELYGMNITARKKSAQIIIKELSNITNVNNENGVKVIMNPNFLSRTVAILQKVVGLNISDGSVNILGPASNILDEVNRKYWRNMTDERLIRDLVITLQNYGFQLGEVLKNDRSSSRIFQNHSNVQLYVTYQKRSELSPQNSLFNFPNSSFTLSPDALSNDCGAVIVVVWYKTLNLVLRKSGFNGDYHAIKSRIIIASVQPEPRMPFKEPVRISWDATEADEAITCGYWKPELGVSKWKTDGCKIGKSNNNHSICECYHLTAFATMDIGKKDLLTKGEQEVLEIVSTVGSSLSLAGVLLTILAYVLQWKRLHKDGKSKISSKVLMNLCVAIGMANFLSILSGPARNHEPYCITVSLLLYFFILALFGWMLCEGIVIYLKMVNVYASLALGGKHMQAFYVVGWGL
ncbi:adhesion G protein-coupled receptor B3-like [Dendronephthya gigantea]|uniref:adhesion G protein-coupled receptor B3-like n=1 Tax=Dendronephthya gigantea TaxID=151771 RepID=UPI00106C8038|nr:adhesion G protein-coupled receptor B3-like [Dendronephthya gigantea]